MQRKEDDVTPKQRKFCYEYLKDLNAKAAAIRAGYSKKTAEVTGCKLKKRPEIKNKIRELREAYMDEAIMSAKEVEYILSKAARGEMEEETIVTEGIGEGKSRAIKMMKQIGARDRIRALELMGKRHDLFAKETEVQVTPIIITGEGEISD